MQTVRLRITGRVQGVGYRVWAMRTAATLGLDGWVRNRRDGTVELLATGAEPEVAAMVEACRQGPGGAEVAAVETCEAEPDGSRGFTSRPTG
ncbi:MAG TPA: acylphosphatase [Stellaceae bacterium]|jgi:acylphosphatase